MALSLGHFFSRRKSSLAASGGVAPAADRSDVREQGDSRSLQVRPYIVPGNDQPRVDESGGYFLVASQGLAGSIWVASSLNLIPGITCSMGIDHPFVSMSYYYNRDMLRAKMEGISGLEPIKHGFYRSGLRDEFATRIGLHGIAGNDLVRVNPVEDLQIMYDELEWFSKADCYGNVHSCFVYDALRYLEKHPTKKPVRIMNLIRHPIPRTEAAIRGVLSIPTRYADSDWHRGITEGVEQFADENVDRRRDIERRFAVDFTDTRNRAVLYSYYVAIHNESWATEISMVTQACHVLLERLMGDRDYFSWFVAEITGGRIRASTIDLDNIFSEYHLQSGRHTGSGRSLGPREQYEAWTDWEKFEFQSVMKRLDLARTYAPFGYDFSFVESGSC